MAFGTTIGDTPLVKAYVGTTPAIRMYAGDKHVWPPISATVTYIGSQVFTGTTSVNFPTHSPGDLLVILSVGGAAPTPPSGWTAVHTSPSGNPAATIAYKWATGTTASTGTWTGNAAGTMYVFRGANTATPFGAIGTSVGASGTTVTAPGITLTDPSGNSAVVHAFYNNGTTGAWVAKIPANFISKNQQARLASNQMIVTEAAATDPSVMTHSASSSWRSLAFEVLAPGAGPEPQELYGVDVEYLPNYEVRFTAKKGFTPADPGEEAFMFRCAEMPRDGYTAREFTKTWAANGYSKLNCTLEDLYGDGTNTAGSLTKATINFTITPRA
jgi:hypothetical protein